MSYHYPYGGYSAPYGAYPPPPVDRKPGLVTGAQVVLWIQTGLGALAVCLLGLIFAPATADGVPAAPLAVLLVLAVAITALNAGCAVGVGQRRNGARITAIVTQAVFIGLSAVGFVLSLILAFSEGGDAVAGGVPLGSALHVAVIVCLVHPTAREWFERGRM